MLDCWKRGILSLCLVAAFFALEAGAQAYIGYVYPAGGQQGTTVSIRIGGQRIDTAIGAIISGEGVQANVTDCFRRIGNQEMRLLREQLKIIKKSDKEPDEEIWRVKENIEKRIAEYQRLPASAALSTLILLEVTISKDAKPGLREIRTMTSRGLSNPLPFYVGQLPETSRPAMKISTFQTLGKEHLAQRKRPEAEEEITITLPCTVNGQIASGEINRYRFTATQGQRLVITTLARQLVPYIADAVPGWFQPVLTLRNAAGKEMAFNDDYRFNPDPTLLYEVPATGEYILSVQDSIYRGREDFVYRITLGEIPFITSIFPAGAPAGDSITPEVFGWNLRNAQLTLPDEEAVEGIHLVTADCGDALSNPVPFIIDTLPEQTENPLLATQKLRLPIIVNGRIDPPGDQDIYQFYVNAGDTLVAEINARRLDSPLDSFLKLTDANGKVIAFNDDHADPGSGLNTHHADSYLRITLHKAGTYSIHLTDTAHQGGEAYIYRLRLSPPRPDFALRTVPSRVELRKLQGKVDLYAIRKDGYNGAIRLRMKTPGFKDYPVILPAGEERVPFPITCTRKSLKGSIPLTITGTAKINGRRVVRTAVPSEDWMQAFLWRHLVPTQELLAFRYRPPSESERPLPANLRLHRFDRNYAKMSPQKKRVIGRIRRIGKLYQEWLLTGELYAETITNLLDYETPK